MDNDFLATVHEIGSHRVRAQHGVAAWIVGDADGVETGMFRKGTGQYQDLTAAEVGNQAAGCGELGDGDEGLPTIEKIAKRMLSPRGGSHGLGHPTGLTNVSVAASAGWSCSGRATVTCSITTAMALGSSATITITATAPSTAQTLSNTATVSLSGDPNSANNSATTYTVVRNWIAGFSHQPSHHWRYQ